MKSKHDDRSYKHWQKRQEPKWEKFQFNQPFGKGLKRLNDLLEETNYDPATLWQWGTMQAMAVLGILKSVEKAFGRDGQKIIFESLKEVGYNTAKQVLDGTSVPDEMSNAEWFSFFATIINRVCYASLETPKIENENEISIHIDWCPHQDHYKAFDCRVQRYFVQGMIDAALEFLKSIGREDVWDIFFKATIPAGNETCLFIGERGDRENPRKWGEYTRLLEEKGLEIASKKQDP